MINDINVDGRVANDVKYGATSNGTPVARFNFANSYIDSNKNQQVQFLLVTAYDKTADYCHKWLSKGQRAFINGRYDNKTSKDRNGNYNNFSTVVIKRIDPIHYKKQSKSTRNIYGKLDALTKRINKISKKHKS